MPPTVDIYDPSTIHALITTAGDQDQQEDRCQHCLLSECVTVCVCVWTEGWCRVGHIVTMALFLVTTQRNNKQLSSPPPPPPPPSVYLRLRIHGAHTKTDYPAIYILQMKCFNPPRSVPS